MSKLVKGRRVGASLSKGRIENPVQGISQQPPSSRPASKCQDSINTWPSPVEGLTRRRPTLLSRRVSASQLTDLFADTILTQPGERYSFLLNNAAGPLANLNITLDGAVCDIDIHGAGLSLTGNTIVGTTTSYLYQAADLKGAFQLINSGAVALLLNRNKATALLPELSPVIAQEALIFIQAVTFDVGYVVTLDGVNLTEFRTPKSTDTVNALSTSAVATDLATKINAASGGYTAVASGPLVYFKKGIDRGPTSIVWAASLGVFVGVNNSSGPGTGMRGLRSTNGTFWSNVATPVDNQWVGLDWAPSLGLFVAVANTGTGNRVMTSPNGTTWTIRTSAADVSWNSVCWSAALALFVAVASTGTGNRVMTSPNGTTWTIRTSAADNSWTSVCYSPALTLFVAVALSGAGNRVMTSPNGTTWTIRTSAADNDWQAVCWSPELAIFVAVASFGTGNRVMTSTNGTTWTIRTSAADNAWNGVCWSATLTLFVAVSNGGVMTSPDGINWTARTCPTSNWRGIAWSPTLGLFVAGSQSGTNDRIMTSPDGINWTTRETGAAQPFTASLEDQRSGTLGRVIKDSIKSFSSLPEKGRNGFVIKITSDPSVTVDDYWVKYVTASGADYGEGGWQECPAPSIQFKVDPDTMPLVVYRAANKVFFVGPADGAARSITVGPTTYNYTFPLWGPRTCGDGVTAPTPSFFGKPIRDQLIFRGRYVAVSAGSVVMSETENIFNFFNDTSTTVLDTDPIDLFMPAESSSTPALDWALAADESVLLFSATDQYQVRAADQQVLTPRTAEVLRLSSIGLNTLLRPKLAGPNILFGTVENSFTGFREYQFIDTQSRRPGLNLGGSLSVTSEIPRLMAGIADLWDASESLDYAVVSSPSNRKTLYVYKYLWSTSESSLSKKQSAWQKWTFDGDVQWAKFYDNRLWLLLSYSDGTYLMQLPTPELRDAAAPELCLDRAINFPECNSDAITTNNITAVYNSGPNTTTFTLPYSVAAGSTVAAVVRYDNGSNAALQIGSISSGNSMTTTVNGNWTTAKLTFGSPYLTSHTFSPPYPPTSKGNMDQTGRLQLLHWITFHSNSGPYIMRVKRNNRAVDTLKTFPFKVANVVESGRLRSMVATRNTDSLVSVESSTIFPFSITGAEWEGAYNDRAQ